jgi:hypothetical protein
MSAEQRSPIDRLMDRRRFLFTSMASLFSAAAGVVPARSLFAAEGKADGDWAPLVDESVKPRREISAAVDVLVPADPEIPGDFKGTAYGGDKVVAAMLGDPGQILVVTQLNQYANKTASKPFIECSPEEQLAAIKQWISEREGMAPLMNELLIGFLSLSVIGTYENNPPEVQREIFEKMGWFDPKDAAGTFRIPNEGYVDVHVFPPALKKGVRK